MTLVRLASSPQDNYTRTVINKYKANTGLLLLNPGLNTLVNNLKATIGTWANSQLLSTTLSGSFAKGTATTLSTDVDLFISLKSDTTESLEEVYGKLFQHVTNTGYSARKQNVSIGITYQNYKIDLVPAVKHQGLTSDHSLYRNKIGSWTKTNIAKHINLIQKSGRIEEIKAAKIWRTLNDLEFPSFYLELSVLNALSGCSQNRPGQNFLKTLSYLSSDFLTARIVDPVNSNNIISDDLTASEKQTIANAAKSSRQQAYMKNIIW